MTRLSTFWQKLIIWITSYANVIAFVICGGYLYFKGDDEDARGSAKLALLVYGGFTALELTRALIYNILSIFGAGYETLSVMSDIGTVISINRAICFVVLAVLDILGVLGALKAKLHGRDS
ncbi:MAG: hypothetical protein IJD51_02135 [Clostridia bacterium]|nr:hypothetical protein [Clostridia bacterium]